MVDRDIQAGVAAAIRGETSGWECPGCGNRTLFLASDDETPVTVVFQLRCDTCHINAGYTSGPQTTLAHPVNQCSVADKLVAAIRKEAKLNHDYIDDPETLPPKLKPKVRLAGDAWRKGIEEQVAMMGRQQRVAMDRLGERLEKAEDRLEALGKPTMTMEQSPMPAFDRAISDIFPVRDPRYYHRQEENQVSAVLKAKEKKPYLPWDPEGQAGE